MPLCKTLTSGPHRGVAAIDFQHDVPGVAQGLAGCIACKCIGGDSYVVDLQSIINGATTLFAFGFTHLHTRNTSSLTRNHALRTFLVTGTLLFRLCRTLDLLSSADRAAFAHSTTEMLRKPRYDIASTWCCFCQGLVCGHLHPPTPVYSRFFFVLLVMGSVVIPLSSPMSSRGCTSGWSLSRVRR